MSRSFGAAARRHVSQVMESSFGIVGFLRSQGALSGAAPIAVAAALRGKPVAEFADELAGEDDPTLSGFERSAAGEEMLESLAGGADLDEFCAGLDERGAAAVGPRFGSVTDERLARSRRASELGLALEEYDAAMRGSSVEDVLRQANADIVASSEAYGDALVTGRVEELARRRGQSRRVYSRGVRDFAAKAAAADIAAATASANGPGAEAAGISRPVGAPSAPESQPRPDASASEPFGEATFELGIDEMEHLVLEGAVSASEAAVSVASEQAKASAERIEEMAAAVEVVVDY